MNNITFDEIKNTLQNNFLSLGCSNNFVNQLLTDNFINGLLNISTQNENNYSENFCNSMSELSNQTNLSSVTNFYNIFKNELKINDGANALVEYMKDNLNQVEMISPINMFTNKTEEIVIDKSIIAVLGALSLMALIAGGPAGFATFALAAAFVGPIFFEFDENGNLRYKEDNYFTNPIVPSLTENFETASSTPSPLVVDLDGDGVETVGTQSGTHFDHDGNGFAESTGWAGKDDGILIRDLNNNGQIDSAYNLVRI